MKLRLNHFGPLLLAGTLAVSAAPALARTVEYLDDLAAIRAAADDQGIQGPFSDQPGPGTVRIALETPKAADHRVIVASVYCQAYGIDNPVSTLLQDLVRASAPLAEDTPALTLRILSSSTVLRCFGKSDLEIKCKNRVRITAEASFLQGDGKAVKMPLVAQVEREGRVGGFCGNIARYTGIVTREAGIDLIRQALKVSAGIV
ncbi:MAG: hypothetical protein KKD64_07340 [Alphaproteobacteria bacterium]|nr:hypothetical protein [Alphaproteobacteria bacterium]MBU0793708.1 hypothetical protein [Alphaproteobacteria bacterium]MBU0876432.1 hypothetical protein [Alphaproteobacteria bacterium]MBU1769451.1 hypothetical protein [Alphaproteobacteria bacterium]